MESAGQLSLKSTTFTIHLNSHIIELSKKYVNIQKQHNNYLPSSAEKQKNLIKKLLRGCRQRNTHQLLKQTSCFTEREKNIFIKDIGRSKNYVFN